VTETPRITALIDTYNQGVFLDEAIESVLAQGFPAGQMEILVVDDGSTDDTPERVKKYGQHVRYIRKANGGQASALNVGFAESRGEIVAMLDGDDVWLPGKIRAMVEEFERHPEAGLVFHPYQIWDPERGTCWNTEFHAVSGDVTASLAGLLTYGDFGTCGMAVRKSVVQKLLPIPEGLVVYADLYLVCLIIFLAPVAARAEHLTRYRQHAQNLTSFNAADRARQERRWSCYAHGIEQVKAWLAAHGYDLNKPDIAAFLTHQELAGREMRFLLESPNRREYFRFLREHAAVHRCLWTPSYRMFQRATSLLALALGYRRYESLRHVYRGVAPLLRARQAIMPDEQAHLAASPASVVQPAEKGVGAQRA
jgi:glycosyltransferase involved in cell wall biosynthesis